jgi:GAF domain-containing protein
MAKEIKQIDLISLINSLSEVPLMSKDKQEALKKITLLGKQLLGSQICTLILVDINNRTITHEACAGFDERFEQFLIGRKITIGSSKKGYFVDIDLLAKGEGGEWVDLQENGQGIVNPKIAKRYNFNSVLSYPLKSDEGLMGYFNHFSARNEPFTADERKLIAVLARQALITIERFDYLQSLDYSLRALNDISKSLLSESPSDSYLNQVAEKAVELFSVDVCIVWQLDEKEKLLSIVATTPQVDAEYKDIKLGLDEPGIRKHLLSKKPGHLLDVRKPQPKFYKHHDEASKRGWISLLSAPMWGENKLVGMLDVYTKRIRNFKKQEKELFDAFANHAALSMLKAALLGENAALQQYLNLRERERTIAKVRDAVSNFTSDEKTSIESQLDEVLKLIVKECASKTGANTCFLRLWDKATDLLKLKQFYDEAYQDKDKTISHQFEIGESIAGHVAQTGEAYIWNDLPNEPLKPLFSIATRPSSILCVPIKSGGAVIGTISVGSSKIGAFGEDEKELLEGIMGSVSNAIGRANLADNLLSLAQASHEADSPEVLLNKLVEFTRDVMNEPVCLVWLLDKDRDGFTVRAFAGPDDQRAHTAGLFISNTALGMDWFLRRRVPLFFKDASRVTTHPYADKLPVLDWKSMMAMPLVVKNRVIGILEVYSIKNKRNFTDWHKKLFASWAAQASIAIVNVTTRKRLKDLGEITQQMAETNNVDDLLELILKSALKLADTNQGWISRLDLVTGKLEVRKIQGDPDSNVDLKVGEGITGKALQDAQPIMADNVLDEKWHGIYVKYWDRTRSELAVPILISNAEARIGSDIKLRDKPIAVLNVESPTRSAFSEADQDVLWSLARLAAITIERLDLDRKLRELTDFETEIVRKHGFDETIKVITQAITETLGYDYVNISLVVPEQNQIRTEHVVGIPEELVEKFKRSATHSLDSNDIQASIVRDRKIEVPGKDDKRFDRKIYDEYGHKDYIRVFLPMIVPSDEPPGVRVVGTVEAGYKTPGYREYIYEQDVQILQGFLNYAVQALENRKQGLLEQISHEFRSPTVGIKSHASFLQARIAELDKELVNRKFQDIITDCEILLYQIGELEHILGMPSPVTEPVLTNVFRDIIIKTIHQVTPLIKEKGFNHRDVEYKGEDIGKIKIFVKRPQLNQVVYNLLTNSIKYAEDDPNDFKIRISVDTQDKANYIVIFKDWGIGVKRGLEEKIFEEGFRTPEAMNKNVTGSGLGLTLARKIMKELGGDLKLNSNYKPTEFHVILPKNLREMPK